VVCVPSPVRTVDADVSAISTGRRNVTISARR
jgi:hypothetical protein